MARPKRLNGGCKPTFPSHVADGLLDLVSIRHEIEEGQEKADNPNLTLKQRRLAKSYWNAMETALDIRIEMMRVDVESHERALDGQALELCRVYHRSDPTYRELLRLAEAEPPSAA